MCRPSEKRTTFLCRDPFEKLIVTQSIKKFPAFKGPKVLSRGHTEPCMSHFNIISYVLLQFSKRRLNGRTTVTTSEIL
jgi:hypothetical protein